MNTPGDGRWTALGTYVFVEVDGDQRAATALARLVLEEVDAACSRFRADSDLFRANARAGRWTTVSPLLCSAVEVAIEAAQTSGGRVDPTLGQVISHAGYDRTYTELVVGGDRPTDLPGPLRPGESRWRSVAVRKGEVFVPVGAALDLGATGKAFAADLVALSIAEQLHTTVFVSVGGEVRVAGGDPDEPRWWPVAIAETLQQWDNQPASTVIDIAGGGIATSTVLARRWRRGGRDWHHIIDPRTGLPAQGPWRTVTAIGHTCAAANTASVAALVAGPAALEWLESQGVAARLVGHDASVAVTSGWPDRNHVTTRSSA